MKTEKGLKIILLLLIITGISSLFTGITFSIFSATLKGKKVNEISTSKITFTYNELKDNTVSAIMTDEYGIENADYLEFSTTVKSTGMAKLNYYVYLEADSNNTLEDNKVRVYLTDEKDIPINDDFKDLENGRGKICYDYVNSIEYNIGSLEYNNCIIDVNNMDSNTPVYLMDRKYYKEKDNISSNVCRKYTKIDGKLINEIVDTSNCIYGDLYKGKANAINFNKDKYNIGLNNIIYANSYEFRKEDSGVLFTKTYRLRAWSNDVSVSSNVIETETGQSVETNPLTYKFNINIYSEQVELGS